MTLYPYFTSSNYPQFEPMKLAELNRLYFAVLLDFKSKAPHINIEPPPPSLAWNAAHRALHEFQRNQRTGDGHQMTSAA